MTLGSLRQRLEQQFGVAPPQQRLLLKGEIGGSGSGGGPLAADATPIASLIPANSRVVLIGTPVAELAAYHESSSLREEGRINYAKYQTTSVSQTRDPLETLEHTFHSFETLPGLLLQAQALAMLRRLARDVGVRQIMSKRKYSVGVLRELHPNERTILGYNRNRGQVIALRLRTDDLDGFRDYDAVRKVLMHELAHMVWDEHDDRFHSLNREHCQELEDLDWTRRGQTVSGSAPSSGPRFQQPTADDDMGHVDGGALTSSGFVLGGTAPQLPPDSSTEEALQSRRDLAFEAWQRRREQ
ncbi:hypothetical protein GGF44_005579 [Coemansia sp. RSA 1694]|nr:hypothetical protein GGF38_004981 [Coemansia sp. RSA 25]KAJ2619846.1 hypothetical protein GGF44_005579 [Coemansia sp. RSA 1694]